jgi:hypothetical protein
MRSVLRRLQHAKLVLGCLVLAGTGAALIALGKAVADDPGLVSWIPWAEFGGVLIGAGVLSIGLDRFLRREQEAIDEMRLRQLLADQAPLMRDAVLSAFAANHQDLKRIATPQMLDQVISNSLALRLDDQQFASEVYADIRDQAISAPERWYDATLDVTLRPVQQSLRTKVPAQFEVTVRWEYRTTPAHLQRRFVCLSDREEYAELLHQRDGTSVWFINPTSKIDASKERSFELTKFSIDGQDRPIRRTARGGAQTYSVTLGDITKTDELVTIAYTYRARMARTGNLLFFDIEQPTRDLRVSLDHDSCGIASLNVLDMVPSVRPTRLELPESPSQPRVARIDIDGWVFPRSGIAFVWTVS